MDFLPDEAAAVRGERLAITAVDVLPDGAAAVRGEGLAIAAVDFLPDEAAAVRGERLAITEVAVDFLAEVFFTLKCNTTNSH